MKTPVVDLVYVTNLRLDLFKCWRRESGPCTDTAVKQESCHSQVTSEPEPLRSVRLLHFVGERCADRGVNPEKPVLVYLVTNRSNRSGLLSAARTQTGALF